jgi:HlyD family secretion protein
MPGVVDIPRRPKTKKRALALVATAAALLTAVVVITLRVCTPAAPQVQKASVWTERVRSGDLIRQVPVQGVLEYEKVQWLSAVSAARVAKIEVRPGAQVEADTVVVVLENADLELAALEAERQASTAESQLIQLDVKTSAEEKLQGSSLAQLGSDRQDAENRARVAQDLSLGGLMSQQDVSSATLRAEGLTARFAAEQARQTVLHNGRIRQLEAQKVELDRLRKISEFRRGQLHALQVRAGISGIVQEIPLETGAWVVIGSVLAKIAEPGRLRARLKVAESDAKDVHRGQIARFETATGAFSGVVSRVDPSVTGGNVGLEVALDTPLPDKLRADQTVTGFVEIERLEKVTFVARPAGVRDESTATVFRVEPDGEHASQVKAGFGRGSAREVQVLGGLRPGDQIVVSDTSSWEAASRVRLN